MNSFVQSKTEVLEKIEESLRPLCIDENLKDDEVMELCILYVTAAVLNPSKFASIGTRFGLREGGRSGFDNCKSQRNDVGPQP